MNEIMNEKADVGHHLNSLKKRISTNASLLFVVKYVLHDSCRWY